MNKQTASNKKPSKPHPTRKINARTLKPNTQKLSTQALAQTATQRPHIPVSQSLGIYLRKRREARKYSQNELAEMLGYQSGQVVSNWERGLQSPPFVILTKLTQFLQISQSEIVAFLLKEQKRIFEVAFESVKKGRRRSS